MGMGNCSCLKCVQIKLQPKTFCVEKKTLLKMSWWSSFSFSKVREVTVGSSTKLPIPFGLFTSIASPTDQSKWKEAPPLGCVLLVYFVHLQFCNWQVKCVLLVLQNKGSENPQNAVEVRRIQLLQKCKQPASKVWALCVTENRVQESPKCSWGVEMIQKLSIICTLAVVAKMVG